MEHKSDPSTDVCKHCGQPTTTASKNSELQAVDPPAVEAAPLFEVRTPGGRVVYVVNLN